MSGPKKADPTDIKLALAFILGMGTAADLLKQAGVGAGDPEVERAAKEVGDDLRRQYDQKIRDEAWLRRSNWRKADFPSLVRIFLLPGIWIVDPEVLREIALLYESNKTGAPALRAKTFDESLQDGLDWGPQLANAATSTDARRSSPWYPRLIEAAYRGELAAEKRSRRKSNEEFALPASEIAEEKVAEAAGITPSMVHELCKKVRDEDKKKEVWAAAQPGRGVVPEPPMTANELRRHLANVA